MSSELGIDDQTMESIGRWRESDQFSTAERLALELTDAVTLTPAGVSDELRGRLLDHFTPAQLTELASAVAWENHRARLNKALGVRDLGLSDGAFCLPPQPPSSE